MSKLVSVKIEFTSEPGINIQGTEFRVSTTVLIDERGYESITQRATGRADGSCAWFFVPPAERIRLEALGVKFKEFERVVVGQSAKMPDTEAAENEDDELVVEEDEE